LPETLTSESTRRQIAERLARLRADTVPNWGKMNAPGMICHLNDSFLTAFGEKEVSSASGLLQRTVMKWFALHVPAQWPRDLPTRPEVQQGVGGTCPTDFDADRALLLQTIERFARPDPEVGKHPHPIFGLMSRSEWMRWGYRHADHHLRQFGV